LREEEEERKKMEERKRQRDEGILPFLFRNIKKLWKITKIN